MITYAHLTNFGGDDLVVELLRAAENATALVAALRESGRYPVFNLGDLFELDKDSSLMVTSSGALVWRGTDAVHLSDEAYAEVAAALVS